jgi:hypothetical protein
MTITTTIARADITTEWALWTDITDARYAVAMTREDGSTVWVGTDGPTAHAYGRVNGWDLAARITDPTPVQSEEEMLTELRATVDIRRAALLTVTTAALATGYLARMWTELGH